MVLDIDYNGCIQKGLIGGIGAIPGTMGSHPMDVIKINMQVKGDALRPTIQSIYRSSSTASIRNFYRGFFPAIEQRMVTRAPMFLCSELYTQIVYQNTGLSKVQATYVGSMGSGFTTGSIAGIAEYRKKLLSQNVVTKKEARWDRLFMTAKRHGTLGALGRRMVAAGVCSATYDSVFFGTEAVLAEKSSNPAFTYGGAAVCAVVAAFAFDTTVARMMVVPPQTRCLTFANTLKGIFRVGEGGPVIHRVMRGYRGLSARAVEFFINYSITGATSVYVVMAFAAFKQASFEAPEVEALETSVTSPVGNVCARPGSAGASGDRPGAAAN